MSLLSPFAGMTARQAQARKNVALLSLCQGLSMTAMVINTTFCGLIGMLFAPDALYATIPYAMIYIVSMASAVPASLLMRKIGRKGGLIVGQIVGVMGFSISLFSLFQENFYLFLFGMSILGYQQATANYYRFAAADTADDNFKSRAISLVLAGGVLAAIIAPLLSQWSHAQIEGVLYAGSYIIALVASLSIIAILLFIKIPPLTHEEKQQRGRPFREIASASMMVPAMASAAVGYGVMVLIMTSAPLSMKHDHFITNDIITVIQWHVLAMFVPSFFTGNLIKKFGARQIILSGLAINCICVIANINGMHFINYWTGLFALGIGWNFMFIGGSSLLTDCYHETEKAKIQGVNDLAIGICTATAAFSSGFLVSSLGWDGVNIAMLLPLSLVGILFIIYNPRYAIRQN